MTRERDVPRTRAAWLRSEGDGAGDMKLVDLHLELRGDEAEARHVWPSVRTLEQMGVSRARSTCVDADEERLETQTRPSTWPRRRPRRLRWRRSAHPWRRGTGSETAGPRTWRAGLSRRPTRERAWGPRRRARSTGAGYLCSMPSCEALLNLLVLILDTYRCASMQHVTHVDAASSSDAWKCWRMPMVNWGRDPQPLWQPSSLTALMAMAANVDDGSVTKRMLGRGHAQSSSRAWTASRFMAGTEAMSQTCLPTWSTSADKRAPSRG